MRQRLRSLVIGYLFPAISLLATAPPATLPVTTTAPAATSTSPAATAQAQDPLIDFLNGGGLKLTITTNGDLCTLTTDTTTAPLAQFLAYIVDPNRPIHMESIAITAPKPGVDVLHVEMHLTLHKPGLVNLQFITCLRDVTSLFPQKGNTIWATAFRCTGDGAWILEGKCTDAHFAQDLAAAMSANDHFRDPALSQANPDASGGNWGFTITFTYKPPTPP